MRDHPADDEGEPFDFPPLKEWVDNPMEWARAWINHLWYMGIIGDGEERRKQVERELFEGRHNTGPGGTSKILLFLSSEAYAYLLHPIEKKPAHKGRGRPRNLERDGVLVGLLQDLHDYYGIPPTRSESKRRRDCGASILAKAMEERGIDIGESALAAVWARRAPDAKLRKRRIPSY
jgi:hypothetical protein